MRTMTSVGLIALFLCILSLTVAVRARSYYTIYNPFTGNFDYYSVPDSSDNITVNNLTVANINLLLGFDAKIGLNNMSACSEGQIPKFTGGSWVCGADSTASTTGANYFAVYGQYVTGNESSGGKMNMNMSIGNFTIINIANSLSLAVGNITGHAFGDNTSDQVFTVCNNGSFYSPSNPLKFYNSSNFTIDDYYTNANIEARKYYNSSNFTIDDYYTKTNIEAKKYYNASNFTIDDYYTNTQIEAKKYYNSSNFTIDDYYTNAQIEARKYYNASNFTIDDYYTNTKIIGFNHYNSSDFSITDYYTRTIIESLGYYNASDFTIDDYYTNAEIIAFNHYNSTDLPTCTGNDKLTSTDGSTFVCAADVTGSSSGTNYWSVYGVDEKWMEGNQSTGAPDNLNMSKINISDNLMVGGTVNISDGIFMGTNEINMSGNFPTIRFLGVGGRIKDSGNNLLWQFANNAHLFYQDITPANVINLGTNAANRMWQNLYLSTNLSDGTNNVTVSGIITDTELEGYSYYNTSDFGTGLNTTAEMQAACALSPTGNSSAQIHTAMTASTLDINTTKQIGLNDDVKVVYGTAFNATQYFNGTCFRTDVWNGTDLVVDALCPSY